jgi:endoglucanase
MRSITFAFLAAVLIPSCHSVPEPSAGKGGVEGAAVSDKKCPADYTIDDAEDNNNQVVRQKGRAGYWYTYGDKLGSTITPPTGASGGKFAMSAGGANGSKFAAHMSGQIASSGEPLYSGMGFSFTDPKAAYDAKANGYTGISFWAKIGSGSAAQVRLKVPDVATDPDGKVCTNACFNDFGADLTLTETWTKYTIPFSTMTQMDGWGDPHPPAIDASKLYGVQFQVTTMGAQYDVWIDDLQFTGCP